MEVAERAEAQIAAEPDNPNAHYMMAFALGRYSQGISVAKALSQGLGNKIKTALERCDRAAASNTPMPTSHWAPSTPR